ncbi:MAG: hypothetical protein J5725_00780 [Bacteroidales bacterium]|nr:hypothetical protein [Bacteroidales bacterium]
MIHGKTKIELYNPKLNVKEIIKSENTFQSAVLANFMKANGIANNSPWGNTDFSSDYWKSLVGGLFLFKNGIEVGSNFMPAGNIMVGCGVVDETNANFPNEIGTYNSQESSASSSAITQVYDFSTNQANGTISCACLTSKVGGMIGYGYASGRKWTTNFSARQASRVICERPKAFYNNKVYSAYISDDGVDLYSSNAGVTQGSIFDSLKGNIKKSYEVSNPYSIPSGSQLWLFNTDKVGILRGIARKSSSYNVSSGDNIYYYEFDIVNDTCTVESLINSSGTTVTLWTGISALVGGLSIFFAGKYLFVQDTNYKLKCFDCDNGIYVKELGSVSSESGNRQNYQPAMLDTNLYLFNDSELGVRIFDVVNDTIKNVGMNNALANRIVGTDLCVMYGSGGLYHNPLYLATINNLQSPVTKTAAQTMKVTYTLTEA